jgi:hypothetical protein
MPGVQLPAQPGEITVSQSAKYQQSAQHSTDFDRPVSSITILRNSPAFRYSVMIRRLMPPAGKPVPAKGRVFQPGSEKFSPIGVGSMIAEARLE